MVQIVRIEQIDDMYASMYVSVMPCSSIEKAKETILGIVNMDFDGNWESLTDAASELNCDIEHCNWDGNTFRWFDNGKGDTYIIANVNEKEMDGEFQNFGTI